MGEIRNAYKMLVSKSEVKRPLGGSRTSWEDNIKMDLREISFRDVDWIHLAQDRNRWLVLVKTVLKLCVP
jgi:hypothetical protein